MQLNNLVLYSMLYHSVTTEDSTSLSPNCIYQNASDLHEYQDQILVGLVAAAPPPPAPTVVTLMSVKQNHQHPH